MSLLNHSGGSRRWNYFHSALELAIQRSAHKWKRTKDGAMQTFNQVADYIESANQRDLESLFQEYDLQNNVDILDKMVSEAKARKASGKIGPNVWTENLHPRAAVAGRTIPVLEAQAKRLRESLAELEAENLALDLDGRTIRMLDNIDETHDAWANVPMEEIQAWTAHIAESTTPTLRS
ncbi:hypothetical protein C8R46DRAFT_1071976 [Mycena filopes]|nr:hypothetical protein C8R46DRAFT_1071976 [Mycena filopes]